MALFAEPIVYVLLGPMWMSVVPIVQILCVTGIWAPTNSLNAKFYIALGMLPVLLRRQAVLEPIKLALIAIAALVSIELVAAAFVMASLLKAVLDLVPLKRRLNYGLDEMLRRAMMNAAVAVASLTPALCLLAAFGHSHERRPGPVAVRRRRGLAWLVGRYLCGTPPALRRDPARVQGNAPLAPPGQQCCLEQGRMNDVARRETSYETRVFSAMAAKHVSAPGEQRGPVG